MAVRFTAVLCLGLLCPRVAQNARDNTVNPAGVTREISGSSQLFAGNIINHGAFKITDTTVSYSGTFTNHGEYNSDPSINNFTDLIIGAGGYLIGGAGDQFIVQGAMQNGSLQSVAWSTRAAELSFRGGGASAHTMSLAGRDMGASYFGTVANFAWDTLRLRAGESLILADGNATPGAAFYAESLILEGGLAQLLSVTGNGFNIYYNPFTPGSAWLGGRIWPVTGGGAIIPMAAILDITAVNTLANGHVTFDVLGAPLHHHTIKASTDLVTFFNIGTVTAAADGTFTYEDSAGTAPGRRFYRVDFP